MTKSRIVSTLATGSFLFILFLLLTGAVTAGLCNSNTIGAPGLGDPLFPGAGNGGIDVQSYVLDISWDDTTGVIEATALLTIKATQDLTAFNLDFHKLDIVSLTVDGQPAQYTRTGDELTIVLPQLIHKADTFKVAISYAGKPVPIPGSVTMGWETIETGAHALGEPISSMNWFPSNNHPSDKATYTFHVTVPKPYNVAANGLPGKTVDNGTTRRFTFIADDPMATYLATVNIDQFVVEKMKGPREVPIFNYYFAGATEKEKAPFKRYPEMLQFFSEKFGDYPFATAGNIMIGIKMGIALETQTRAVFGHPTSENTVVHELAHQWFGDYVSLSRWNDIWLKEGFSKYCEGLWQEHLSGTEAMNSWVKASFESLMGLQKFPRQGWTEILDFFTIEDTELTAEQFSEIIELATKGKTNPDELADALALVPEQGLSNRKLDLVLAKISFEYFDLTAGEFARLDSLLAGKDPDKQGSMPDFDAMVKVLAEPPVGLNNPNHMYNSGFYTRGALAMHALRLKVGDDLFFKILQAYFSRFGGGSAGSDDFITIAKEVSGQDLDPLFDAWLRGEMMPDIPELGLYKDSYR